MDSYLLLAPFLMLIVVGLLGFVGCDLVFGLDYVEPPAAPPTNVIAVPGDALVTITWDPYDGATGYTVKRGTVSGAYTSTFSPMPATDTSYADDTVENDVTYFYVVTATVNGKASQPSVEVTATPSAAAVTSLVVTHVDGPLRNDFTGWVGMGFVVATNPISARRLGRLFVTGNSGAHVIKLVDAATKVDVPGGSTIVSFTTGAVGEFVYGDLGAPVPLLANTTYYLLSQEIAFMDAFHDVTGTSVTVTPAASRVFAVNAIGNSYTEAPIDDFIYGPVDLQYV